MHIALLEPLLVKDEIIQNLFAPLQAAGHTLGIHNVRGKETADIVAAAQNAEVIIIGNMPIALEVIEALPRLKMISVGFTGVDHVPMELCKQKGIMVCNSQGYATRAVVEHVFGLLFALYRKILKADPATRSGEPGAPYFGTELYGKTFGVIGAGAIGREVAKIALAFGCRVLAYNRSERPELKALGIEMASLDEVLQQSDVISLHVPLTDATKGLIDAQKLGLLKPSAVLINAARGPVVDNTALSQALLSGKLAGAGIDVFDMEPPIPAEYPLMQVQDNVVFTPHTAFGTTESFIKRAEIIFTNIIRWMEGNPQNVKSA